MTWLQHYTCELVFNDNFLKSVESNNLKLDAMSHLHNYKT